MSTDVSSVVVFGVGGFGREVAWLVESCESGGRPLQVACFADDRAVDDGERVNGFELLSLGAAKERFPGAPVVVAIGAPKTREAITERVIEAGFVPLTLVHPRVERSRWVEIGEGTVICAGSILTANIRLGRHVQINYDCTVTHDVIMGDYATLAPGVHVSGCVHLGRRAYVGTGATIINGTLSQPLVIGDDAVIGAGACVVKPVPPGTTVVGVPAKPLGGR